MKKPNKKLAIVTSGEKRHNFRLLFVGCRNEFLQNLVEFKRKQREAIATTLYSLSLLHFYNDRREDAVDEIFVKFPISNLN